MTTAGFADVIEIARQDRPSLYDPWADRPEPLVPRHLRFEVERPPRRRRARSSSRSGRVPDRAGRGAKRSPCACSTPTCNPAHERAVAAALRGRAAST